MVADRGIPKRAPDARYSNLVVRYPITVDSTGTCRTTPKLCRSTPEPCRSALEPRRGKPEPWRPTRPWRIMPA